MAIIAEIPCDPFACDSKIASDCGYEALSDLVAHSTAISDSKGAIPQGAAKRGVIKGGVCKRKRTRSNADKHRFQAL